MAREPSIVRRERRADVDLTVSPEDTFELFSRWSRRLARRQRRSCRRHGTVTHHSLQSGWGTEHEYSRLVTVDAEGVRNPQRNDSCSPWHQLEPFPAGLHRQPSLEHDVTLVLGMGVKRRRRVARKEELNQRESPIARLTRQPDGSQRSEEPELLTRLGIRPSRRRAHVSSVYLPRFSCTGARSPSSAPLRLAGVGRRDRQPSRSTRQRNSP